MMKLRKRVLTFAILALLVFSAGCTKGPGKGIISFGSKDPGSKLPFTYAGIHSGTEGIKIEFLPNAPPAELLAPSKSGSSQYSFKIGVKVSNKGASDVKDGWLTLTVEDDYMKVDSFKKPFSVEGKGVFNPGGDSKIEVFDGYTKPFREGQSEKHSSIMLATACYKYSTEVKIDTCIDTDVLGVTKKQKACSVKDVTLSSQGAPLAVTKIETKIFPEGSGDKIAFIRPQYLIHVKNAGDGEVINPAADMSAVCSSELIKSKDSEAFKRVWNVVSVSAKLSDRELVCSPSPIRLRGKEDFVRCSLKEGDKIDAAMPSYTSPLTITLNYGYTTTISKEVTVVREITY